MDDAKKKKRKKKTQHEAPSNPGNQIYTVNIWLWASFNLQAE